MFPKRLWATAGSMLAAGLAAACCWLPLLLLLLGAGAAAVGAVARTVEAFRPVFALLAVALLGAAFYGTYFRRRAGPDGGCSADAEVNDLLERYFVRIEVNVDRQKEAAAWFGGYAVTETCILDGEGSLIDRIVGFMEPGDFAARLRNLAEAR